MLPGLARTLHQLDRDAVGVKDRHASHAVPVAGFRQGHRFGSHIDTRVDEPKADLIHVVDLQTDISRPGAFEWECPTVAGTDVFDELEDLSTTEIEIGREQSSAVNTGDPLDLVAGELADGMHRDPEKVVVKASDFAMSAVVTETWSMSRIFTTPPGVALE